MSYLVRKVGRAVVTLLFIICFNFFLFRIMPGNPVALLTRSERLTPADRHRLESFYGFDHSLFHQFLVYLGNTLTGHFGTSLSTGEPVGSLIWSKVPSTLLLVGLGTVLATVVGVLIGINAAWKRGSAVDRGSMLGSLTLYAVPESWLGMLMLLLFAGTLKWLPAGGYDTGSTTGLDQVVDVANHLLLPCLTLALAYIGQYVVVMRASMLEVMNEPFVNTARAKGVPLRLVRTRHVVPNALLPTIALIFLNFGFVIGGEIVIETVFSWPGIGLLTYSSINSLDYPVLGAVFLLSSAAIVFCNLIADLLLGYLDPRVRLA
jgi:peptide/nickel transport system permease protein